MIVKDGMKKEGAPSAIRRVIARMCMRVARACVNYANTLIVQDEEPVSPKMIKHIQEKWIWRKQQMLGTLRGIYRRYSMIDVFDSLYEGEDKLKYLVASASDAIIWIDEIRLRYEGEIFLCQTPRELWVLNCNLECEYNKMYSDIIQQLDAYQEYIEKRKMSEVFVSEVKAYLKDVRDFSRFSIIFDTPEKERLTKLLSGILTQWKNIQESDNPDLFSSFFYKIERRRVLMDKLWQVVVPRAYNCHDVYDPRTDTWWTEPHAMHW